MPLEPFVQEKTQENQDNLCPFIGLAQDSQTSLSYPSSWNVCHHTKPLGTPNLHFQQSFCFSAVHCTCPIYARLGREPLPSGIRFQVTRPPLPKRLTFSILIGGVVALLAIMGIVRVIHDSNKHGGGLPVASYTVSATRAILPTNTFKPSNTPPSNTLVPPTLTAAPTQTLTSTPSGPTVHPTDTHWPSQTPTHTPTRLPTSTPTLPPVATATFSHP